jgi:multiple sugar transport system substrate-binding protein
MRVKHVSLEEQMRRIHSTLLIAALAAGALAAPLAAQAPTVAALKGQKVKLTLWTHEDVNRMPLEKGYISQFIAANPGVTVDYVTYPTDKIRDLAMTAFAANQGPDIFNLQINDAYPYMANGRVAPIDFKMTSYKDVKDLEAKYLPGTLAPIIEKGKAYGLPLELTNYCLYLNKAIFRDAGLDPDKDYPKTWEDVMAVSEKIVQRNGEILTRRGFDFRYGVEPLICWVPMVEQLGGELISKDGKAIVGDEAWLKVLSFVRDFGPAGKNLGSPTYTAARKVFDLNKNEIAMSFSGLYQEARMIKANPEFYNSKDWMVIPYPQWKDAKKVVPNNFYGHYYMVNAQSSKLQQQAAWSLVNFMLSHGEEYLQKVAIVQPTKALMESKAFKEMPYSSVFAKDMAAAHVVYYGASSTKIDSLLKEAFESVMLVGGPSPKEALDRLRKSVTEVLASE